LKLVVSIRPPLSLRATQPPRYELNKKRHERLWRNPTNNKFVQATGAIRGGGFVLNPRTPMHKNTLPNFSYRMARIIAFLAQIANILLQYCPHVMNFGRLSKALGHTGWGFFFACCQTNYELPITSL
jgi:hypothetical protein